MKSVLQWLVLVFTMITVHTQDELDHLVDYYTKWNERRTQEAILYEFPNDARMHKAENKTIEGKKT